MNLNKKVLETYRRFQNIRERYNTFPNILTCTSSFGEYSAPFLYFMSKVIPESPVLFIDTGFLTKETYDHKRRLEKLFDLDVKTFKPNRSAADLEAEFGRLTRESLATHPNKDELKFMLKEEPYRRGLNELNPASLINGLQRWETPARKNLAFIGKSPKGLFEFHPLFDWTNQELYYFCEAKDLPINPNHIDICKEHVHAECGLHKKALDFQI